MDIRHHFIERGAGETLILLHGNGEDSTYFVHQIDAFATRFHVFAVDTRGHGKTPRGAAPFTIRQFADDLLGFMDEHGIQKAHLLGFSDGGNIALVFTLAHPGRVNRLILNGANLFAAGMKLSVRLPIEIGYRLAKRRAGRDEDAQAKAELLGLMVNDPNITPAELADIHAKSLIIAGTHDMIKDSHTRLIARSIAGGELSIIDGDHFVARKNAAEFNRVVFDFLAS